MGETQTLLKSMVATGVGQQRGKPKFGRRRGKKEPLPKDSLIARALDGGDAPAPADADDRALLLLRAMIAAAHADGTLDDDERRRIMQGHDGAGAPNAALLAAELDKPLDVEALSAAVDSPSAAVDVYAASLMAIEVDTAEERDYLKRLAAGLSLDAETVADLHDRCGAPPLGGALEPESDAREWYFASGGERIGPVHGEMAARYARTNPDAQCWREGFDDWQPASAIKEFAAHFLPTVQHTAGNEADDINFRIVGNDMQFVEVELDPGESVIAEAGALMYKHGDIEMTTVFGDGSGQEGGFMDKLIGAGKRVLTGESLFLTVFTCTGRETRHVAFAAPFPGSIIPVKLSEVGGLLICQKDSFMAAAKGVEIGIHFQKRIMTAMFGGEGFIMQSLTGDGWTFIHAGGTVVERELGVGEQLQVDTGCLAALTASVDYRIVRAGNVKTMVFGGEGVFLANLRGPGRVWLQSMPFPRLVGHISAAMPRQGSGGADVLGSVTNLLR